MKKFFRIAGISLLLVLVVVMLALNFFAGGIVKTAVNVGGTPVLGVPVSLEDASVRLLRGAIRLKRLVIGNPEGFKSDHMFALDELKIDLVPTSVLTDTLHIKEIVIDAPGIIYEMSIGGSNIGTLLDALEPEDKGSEAEAEEADLPGKPAKHVIIDRFVLRNAKVKLTSKLLQGKGVTIPLPTVELTDIGKEKQTSVVAAVTEIVVAVAASIVDAVSASGALLGDGAKAATSAAADAGSALLKGGKAAAGALTDGASTLVGGITGLLQEEAKPAEPAAEQ